VAVKEEAANLIVPMEVPGGDWMSKSVWAVGAVAVAVSLFTIVPCQFVISAVTTSQAIGLSKGDSIFEATGVLVKAHPYG
jgi:hypothetical protein